MTSYSDSTRSPVIGTKTSSCVCDADLRIRQALSRVGEETHHHMSSSLADQLGQAKTEDGIRLCPAESHYVCRKSYSAMKVMPACSGCSEGHVTSSFQKQSKRSNTKLRLRKSEKCKNTRTSISVSRDRRARESQA